MALTKNQLSKANCLKEMYETHALQGEFGITFELFLSLLVLLVHILHLLQLELWEKFRMYSY